MINRRHLTRGPLAPSVRRRSQQIAAEPSQSNR